MTVATQDTALRPARPTLLVAGREEAGLADALLSLLVEETVGGLYRCEATFGNWGPRSGSSDFLYLDRRTLEFGRPFSVALAGSTLFEGRISALEGVFPSGGPPAVTVLAEDRFQDLRMTRRSRSFTDVTDADLLRAVAAEHGLSADVDVPGPRHRVVAQLNQSDLAFLRDRARACSAEVWVAGSALSARRRTGRGGGQPLVLAHGADLREVRVLADLAGQRSSLVVGGWDVAAKAALSETADDAVLGGELAGLESGSRVLRAAFAPRREAVADAVPLTAPEAKARAEALFRRRARRFVVARGVAQTVAGLRVGATVRLDRLGGLLGGEFYVAEVRHRFDGAEGLRTEFVAERAGVGRP